MSARRFAGRDLVRELLDRRRADGSWNRQSNWTAFGIVALRAAGRPAKSGVIRRSADWLARQQNDDGGYSFGTKGGGSFVDETGAALQALAAAGRRRSQASRRAVSYLWKAQNPDGGFGQSAGQRSNAQSTSWAVQGLAAAGANPRRGRGAVRSPVRFLASLQQPDGSFRYSRTSTQTPVWVTAQALAAVRLATLPYPRAPRHPAKKAAKPRVTAASVDRSTAAANTRRKARAARAADDRPPSVRTTSERSPVPVRAASNVSEPEPGGDDDGCAVSAAGRAGRGRPHCGRRVRLAAASG